MKAKPTEQRDFLLAASAWQDSLLQSYRSLHVTIQSFLIAGGVAVLTIQLTAAVQEPTVYLLSNAIFNCIITCLLGSLFWLQRKTASELKGVVESRAADINYWHQLTIVAENGLEPDQRAFTYFKMWQLAQRSSVEHILPRYLPVEGISKELADELVGRGLGHTRRVLDRNLFIRLQRLWYGILIVSASVSLWFFYIWWFLPSE